MHEVWRLCLAVGAAWFGAGVCYMRMRWWRRQCREADTRAEILREVVNALVANDRPTAHALLKAEGARLSEKS